VLAGLEAADRPAGNVLAFIAAEAAVVPIARELVQRWEIPTEAVIVKGYWRKD
jgi:NADPH-dependent ferric siderophore reductase